MAEKQKCVVTVKSPYRAVRASDESLGDAIGDAILLIDNSPLIRTIAEIVLRVSDSLESDDNAICELIGRFIEIADKLLEHEDKKSMQLLESVFGRLKPSPAPAG